jgi:pimeloyl-ACP methyl ester carboxylesterase
VSDRSHSTPAAITALIVMTACAMVESACAPTVHTPSSPSASTAPLGPRESTTRLSLHGKQITLHLASPGVRSPNQPIVLYASGDGGWFGAAVGMFHTLAARGFPVVGFSTKAFMSIEQGHHRPLAVDQVAEAYSQVLARARADLHLAVDAPAVLTGWSRGASLGVLVAARHPVDPAVVGVVAIGLAADERLDIEGGTDDDAITTAADSTATRDGRVLDTYSAIDRIAPRRCVVIQASNDGYLPAAQAHTLFGADSAVKRFVEIQARNHRFNGGEAAFADALGEAVAWAAAPR